MRFLAPLLLASSFSVCVGADLSFDKQTLTKDFVAEGCAVADFDHDGHADVTAGRYIWRGPDFKQKFAYTPERDNPAGPSKTPYTAATGYSDYFIQFAYDFNGDGWSDILVYGLPGEPAFGPPAFMPGPKPDLPMPPKGWRSTMAPVVTRLM